MKWLVAILLFFLSTNTVRAYFSPLTVTNNKYGIHVLDESDLQDASILVNGNGGEWGYVTFVIRKDERDKHRWNRVFSRMKELKLIPIIRIATENKKGFWEKPLEEDAGAWADFLNSLDWPIENRYVILFNEPNHANEWGGEINPSEYSEIARVYWSQLKRRSNDFFVFPAALDLAASNTRKTMDAQEFWSEMERQDELIFTIFDGWNSHSYPNPDFSGNPNDQGRTSISGYKWEVNYLSKYGLRQDIPVLISETGWLNSLGEEKISENLKHAFENVWSDKQVFAVTPFILNYEFSPFDKFSWKSTKTGEFYSYYSEVSNMPKVKGEPKIAKVLKPEVKGIKTNYLPIFRDYIKESVKTKSRFFDFDGLVLG